jgi:aminobenzoyl-glutamate transport protein
VTELPRPAAPAGKGWLSRSLTVIERVGNALPHPGTLFAGMALLVVIVSAITAQFDLVVTHPSTGEEIRPVNLLTIAGIHRMLTQMVTNFTSFAPLGTVLVAMLGIGIAEGSGLIGAASATGAAWRWPRPSPMTATT